MKLMCSFRIVISALVGLMMGVQAQAADYWFDNNGTAAGFGVADGGTYDWTATSTWNTSATGGVGTVTTWMNGGDGAYLTGAGTGTTYTVRLGTDGTTGVTLGNLAINVNQALTGASGNGNVTIGQSGDMGILTLNATNSVGAQTNGVLTINNPINLNEKTLNFHGGNVVVNGIVSGAGASTIAFVKNVYGLAAGTLTLANTDNTYAVRGPTIVGGLTLVVTKLANGGQTSSIGTSSANITMSGGLLKFIGTGSQSSNLGFQVGSGAATIEAAGATTADTISISGTPTFTGSDVLARNITVTGVNTGNNTLSFNYGINAGGGVNSFTKNGTGRWILTGTSTFTGNVTINGGVLAINNSSALGTHATGKTVTINESADKWLELDSSISGGSDITLSNKINFNTSGINGAIRNVSGNNRINGKITMTTGNGNTKIISDGGTLTLAGGVTASTAGRFLDLSGSSTGDNVLTGGFDNISTPSLKKTGTGTWVLAGTNTFRGATSVEGGTLRVSSASALSATNVVTLSADATLDVAGASPVAAPLAVASLTSSGGLLKLSTTDRLQVIGNMDGTFRLTLSDPGNLKSQILYVVARFTGTPPTSVTLEGIPLSWKVRVVAGEIYLQGTVGTLLRFH